MRRRGGAGRSWSRQRRRRHYAGLLQCADAIHGVLRVRAAESGQRWLLAFC